MSKRQESALGAARERWKSVRDECARTSGIVVILFAGLVVSLMGLVSKLDAYPGAIVATRAARRHNELADRTRADTRRTVGEFVIANLVMRSSGDCGKMRNALFRALDERGADQSSPTREPVVLLRPLVSRGDDERLRACTWVSPPTVGPGLGVDEVTDKARLESWLSAENALDEKYAPPLKDFLKQKTTLLESDPQSALAELGKTGDRPWLEEVIRVTIEDAFAALIQQRQSAQQVYTQRRVRAESTTFNLLGLDFSVGSYWAWNVWLFFLLLGMSQMWLSRRRLIRQCRRLFKTSLASGDSDGRPFAGEAFPLWARPLRSGEPWAKAMLNGVSTDVAMEPLGALALALLIVCVTIGVVIVVPMGLVANPLLSDKGWTVERGLHGGLLCLLTAGVMTLAATWRARPPRTEPEGRVEAIGRRTWLAGLLATAGVSSLFAIDTDRNALSRWLLLKPRHRDERPSFRTSAPRIRRVRRAIPTMKPGFYRDTKSGTIHFVPSGGKSRSLGGRHESDLETWDGPYDESMLRQVHPSARVPFVIAAVRFQLKGLTHRAAGEKAKDRGQRIAQKARVNKEKAASFDAAFSLVKTAIAISSKRRNVHPRLYHLLEAIAINSQNMQLVGESSLSRDRVELANMQRLHERARSQSLQGVMQIASNTKPQNAARAAHSRHSRRKRRNVSRRVRYLLDKYRSRVLPDLSAVERDSLRRLARAFPLDIRMKGLNMALSEGETPLSPVEATEMDILKRVIQKASAGEDFSADLVLIPTYGIQGTVRFEAAQSGGPITAEQANAVHVVRRRGPRRRRKAVSMTRVARRPFIGIE